jgi:hypothetical protein
MTMSNKNRKNGALRMSLIAVGLLVGLGAARAEAPAAPAETRQVGRLVGAWKGTGSMTMGADKVEGIKVEWTCRPIAQKWGVGCNGLMTGIPGMARYEETDLFGYDPGAHKLHWFAITNAGETHDHVGTDWTGQTGRFVYDGVQEGKPFKEVVDIAFKDATAKALELHAETFVDGKLTSVLQASARK